MQAAVENIRYGGNEANLHLALSLARNSVFVAQNGARFSDSAVTKLIVVVTNNPSANKSATLRESELVRGAGIGVVTIGVGTYLDRYELSAVASFPYTENMFIVNAVSNLSIIVDPVKRIICAGSSLSIHCCIIPGLSQRPHFVSRRFSALSNEILICTLLTFSDTIEH